LIETILRDHGSEATRGEDSTTLTSRKTPQKLTRKMRKSKNQTGENSPRDATPSGLSPSFPLESITENSNIKVQEKN
jgi:hypothetical protein